MKEYRLSYGAFYDHGDRLLESVVDEGVEVDVAHVQVLIDLVEMIEPRPRLFLANRKHSYSFTFAAMKFIAEQKTFAAVAVVTDQYPWVIFGRALMPRFFSMAIFADREKAINWLRSRL